MRNYLAKADIASGEVYSQIYSSFDDNGILQDCTLTIKFSKIDSKIKDFQCRFIIETRVNPIPYKYRTFNISYDFYKYGSTTNPIFGPTTIQCNSFVEPEDPETATISPVYGICNRIYTPGNTFVDWLSNVNEVINKVTPLDPQQQSPKIGIELPSYRIDTVGYIELHNEFEQVGDLIDPTNTQSIRIPTPYIGIYGNDLEKDLSNLLNHYLNYYGPIIGNQSTIDYITDMFRVIEKAPASEYISIYNNNTGVNSVETNDITTQEVIFVTLLSLAEIDAVISTSNLTVYNISGVLTIDHFATTILYGPGLTYDKIDIVARA